MDSKYGQYGFAWGQILISAIVTAFLSGTVGILLYHYTSKVPDLMYEIFPFANYTKDSTQIIIYSARIENVGSKEAEDVQIYFELPATSNIQDIKVEPSLQSISYTVTNANRPNVREILFPRLNQNENATFSLLVDKGEAERIRMEVRGKGVIGHSENKTNKSYFALICSFLGAVATCIIVAVALSSEIRKIITTGKYSLEKEIQAVRTQGQPKNNHLTEVLLSTRFRLFYNPKVPGLTKSKLMRFGKNGEILVGKNKNESSWRMNQDFLELLSLTGDVHSRFYYSFVEKRFYSTNDPDTRCIQKFAIRDQYIIPEE